MDNDIFELLQMQKSRNELTTLMSYNEKTERFGLVLSEEEAAELMSCRNESLKKFKRVEFGKGILDKLIFEFCDSQYLSQDNYVETLERLQDIFYEFKNESQDKLSDDELLTFMKEQFEDICYGDLEYLEGTCLSIFASAVRAGYEGYKASGGHNEYGKFDEVPRWDNELYLEVVKELFWG